MLPLCSGEGDLRDVVSAVTSLAWRWKGLGIFLGVCPSDLNTIRSDNPHFSSDCLTEMLLKWLKQSYNVCTMLIFHPLPHLICITQSLLVLMTKGSRLVTRGHVVCLLSPPPPRQVERFGEPTWRRLVEAVEDSVGGNDRALAQTIARQHPVSEASLNEVSKTLR